MADSAHAVHLLEGLELLVVQDMATGTRTVLLTGGADPHALPTGHLVFIHNGVLTAVRFDPTRRQVSGGVVPLVEGVAEPGGMPNFAKAYTPEQAEAIRAYLIKRANDLKADPSLP